jgi:hydroxymethylpyrimidine/phosphomethylpyrimidine kinase
MNTQPTLPIALTIAGSDSGGGAGIQADLKTFAALGVFGTSAVTAITAQNPDGVSAIQGIQAEVVAAQIRAVREYFPVGAAKSGMLFSREIIAAVAEAWGGRAGNPAPLVVDPVMVATSGAKLLRDDAIEAMRALILPRAALITPNMDEAALLTGFPVRTREEQARAAHVLYERFRAPVLVKGGHLAGSAEASDVLWDGQHEERLSAPFLAGLNAHGTGCTLSAAIAAHLALGMHLLDAVAAGKRYLHQALAQSLPAGKSTTLNHGFAPQALRLR